MTSKPWSRRRPGDGLRAAVVPVEPGLGDDDAVWTLHEHRTLMRRRPCAPQLGPGRAHWRRCDGPNSAPPLARGRGPRGRRHPVLRRARPGAVGHRRLRVRNEARGDPRPDHVHVGSTKTYARVIAEEGPLILPDLLRASGKRTIVLDHTGDDPQRGWRIYMAYPPTAPSTARSSRSARRARSPTARGASSMSRISPCHRPASCPTCSPTARWSSTCCRRRREPEATVAA